MRKCTVLIKHLRKTGFGSKMEIIVLRISAKANCSVISAAAETRAMGALDFFVVNVDALRNRPY